MIKKTREEKLLKRKEYRDKNKEKIRVARKKYNDKEEVKEIISIVYHISLVRWRREKVQSKKLLLRK